MVQSKSVYIPRIGRDELPLLLPRGFRIPIGYRIIDSDRDDIKEPASHIKRIPY
jgi:hypothetical protein